MGTIRFALRTNKPSKKDGSCMIELIYQKNGVRRFFNTGLKSHKETWSLTDQEFIYLNKPAAKKFLPGIDYNKLPTNDEVKAFNEKLSRLKADIKDIENDFRKRQYAAADVIGALKVFYNNKKADGDHPDLVDFIDTYIESNLSTRVKGSLSVYRSLKNHIQAFDAKSKRKTIFDAISYQYFESFQAFLIDRRKEKKPQERMLNNTTIAKQISTLKTLLGYAKQRGIQVPDSYKGFKIKRQQLEVIALTNDEFNALYNLDLANNPRLDHTRDIFCFSCVTGLRYSDMAQLKREHIKASKIVLTSKKTHAVNTIPLNQYAKEILGKYNQAHRPLPMISNQRLNDYVKELCQLAGINERIEIVRYRGVIREAITYPKYDLIGCHTGRKTFVTLSLEKGMSAEVVMATTGHKDYKSFKRYVNVTEQRKQTAMISAWDENPSKGKLKVI